MAVSTPSPHRPVRRDTLLTPTAQLPDSPAPAADFTSRLSGGGEFQPLEVVPHRLTVALAAGDRGAAGDHQDEVAPRGATHFLHVSHVDQTRTADAQHLLALEGFLRLLQGAARVK